MAYNGFYQNYPYTNQFQSGTSSNLIWVQGEGAAKSYPVAPNSSVPLWDSEANVIYVKSADMSGMPSLKILDYTIRDTTPKSADIKPQEGFATKDDISHLEEEIAALRAKLESVGERKKNDGK